MFLMRADPLRGQVGGGLGPGNLKYFGPKMALAYRLDVISQGPKNSQFSGPNPLPLALVIDPHASKNLRMGRVANPDPRIRIGSGFNQVSGSGSGSGSRRAKITHKSRIFFLKFMF
jgi:hypothetical protein